MSCVRKNLSESVGIARNRLVNRLESRGITQEIGRHRSESVAIVWKLGRNLYILHRKKWCKKIIVYLKYPSIKSWKNDCTAKYSVKIILRRTWNAEDRCIPQNAFGKIMKFDYTVGNAFPWQTDQCIVMYLKSPSSKSWKNDYTAKRYLILRIGT